MEMQKLMLLLKLNQNYEHPDDFTITKSREENDKINVEKL